MKLKIFDILEKYFGYTQFREGQEEIINNLLSKNNTLGIMPTGGGKSLCYQIPAMVEEGTTIVISPLISLMNDQINELTAMGISAITINSSMSNKEITTELEKIKRSHYKLLYVSPERFGLDSFIDILNTIHIPLVIIDEAHCISQWGHDFRKSYLYINEFLAKLKEKPVLGAFTATATQKVIEDIQKTFEISIEDSFKQKIDRTNLFISVIKNCVKKDFLQGYLNTNKNKAGIIYCGTRKLADQLYSMLLGSSYKVGVYHAGLDDKTRNQFQEQFKNDEIDIIVATNAFGMGINKTNIRYVIHYNMPKDLESYYQEIGRAGRDGDKAECILLFTGSDIVLQKFLLNQNSDNIDSQQLEEKNNKLNKIISYIYSDDCYRASILRYFEESGIKDNCGNCSNCSNYEEVDITEEAYKIISTIGRTKEKFGINIISEILYGSNSAKIRDNSLESVSTFGLMKNYKKPIIKNYINTLVSQSYIEEGEAPYLVLKLSDKAWELIKNKTLRVVKKEFINQYDTDNNQELLEALKNVRKTFSLKEKLPPYVICSDKLLKDMSQNLPTSKEELLSLHGMGENKIAKYGKEFIEIIKEFIKENKVTKPLKNTTNKNSDKVKSFEISCELFVSGNSLEEIAKERNIAVTTVEGHIMEGYKAGISVDIERFIKKENEELILETIKKMENLKLREIKDSLPEKITYTEIKGVLVKYGYY